MQHYRGARHLTLSKAIHVIRKGVVKCSAAGIFALRKPPRELPLTLLKLQSRFGDTLLGIRVICRQNGTAVLKGLITAPTFFGTNHLEVMFAIVEG